MPWNKRNEWEGKKGSGTKAEDNRDGVGEEKKGTKIDDNREIDLTFQLNLFNDRVCRENVDDPRPSVLTISPLDRLVGTRDEFVEVAINHPRIQISASR